MSYQWKLNMVWEIWGSKQSKVIRRWTKRFYSHLNNGETMQQSKRLVYAQQQLRKSYDVKAILGNKAAD